MSIFFEILDRIASYGPQIDQSHGEKSLIHIKIIFSAYEGKHKKLLTTSVATRVGCVNITIDASVYTTRRYW